MNCSFCVSIVPYTYYTYELSHLLLVIISYITISYVTITSYITSYSDIYFSDFIKQ